MFYFLIANLRYNLFLIAAAVLPAVFLMMKVYRSDRLEPESRGLLWSLTKAGILSALLALVSERVLVGLLSSLVKNQTVYQVLLYFGVVGISEEGAKYLMLKRRTWNSPEFNCQYDGVVYAVFVSLGFALWENIGYVLMYGMGAALMRAITAVPGHASFGVFMGACYAAARRAENFGDHGASVIWRVVAVLLPALIHGCYDYIAVLGSEQGSAMFWVFVLGVFAAATSMIRKMSRRDAFIAPPNWYR